MTKMVVQLVASLSQMQAAPPFVRSAVVVVALCVCIATLAFGQAADRIEADARGLLDQYSAALESLNAEAVKKLQPSIDLETLKKAFKEMRALDVTIDNIKMLSVDATLARVSCRVSQTLTPKAGSKQTTAVTRVLRLRRAQTGWVIDAFER
jgi:hypothetical protein